MEFDAIAFVLALIYCLMACLGGYQLTQALRSDDKKRSLRNVIVMFLTGSAFLRGIFWLKTSFPISVSDQLMMVVFFLPVWMDFAGLSGLAVFYANMLDTQGRHRRVPRMISLVFNVIFLVINLSIGIMSDDPSISESKREAISIVYTAYSTFLDFLLSGLLLYLGTKFLYSASPQVVAMLPRTLRTFSMVNWLVVACYTIRGVFTALLTADNVLPSSMKFVYFSKNHPATNFSVLLFFLVTEYIPNISVILLLWKVSKPKVKYTMPSMFDQKGDESYDKNEWLLQNEGDHNRGDNDHENGSGKIREITEYSPIIYENANTVNISENSTVRSTGRYSESNIDVSKSTSTSTTSLSSLNDSNKLNRVRSLENLTHLMVHVDNAANGSKKSLPPMPPSSTSAAPLPRSNSSTGLTLPFSSNSSVFHSSAFPGNRMILKKSPSPQLTIHEDSDNYGVRVECDSENNDASSSLLPSPGTSQTSQRSLSMNSSTQSMLYRSSLSAQGNNVSNLSALAVASHSSSGQSLSDLNDANISGKQRYGDTLGPRDILLLTTEKN